MNDDKPTLRVAILGAGPIGLEAALYARYLGYETAVFERGQIAENVRRWGHVRMFSPFGLNRSPLGLAALRAQNEGHALPQDDELLTGQLYAQRYLIPLAQTDLLADCVFTGVDVLAIGRDGILKSDLQDLDRSEYTFRLLVREGGEEKVVDADVVIDTSGVYDTPNYLGHGGIPAVGELACRGLIDYQIPDVLGADRERFANKNTLLVGGGYSAATTLVALHQLRETAPHTTVTWITRRASTADEGPIARVPNDRLPERDSLAQRANLLAGDGHTVTYWGQTAIIGISHDADDDQWKVQLAGQHDGEHTFDRIVAHIGFRPDDSVYSELQVHQCYASEAPMKLATSLLESGSIDCLDQKSAGPATLINPEPDFFILGSKSFGRNSNFLLALGLEQVRDAFTIIADRKDLDLYKTMENLVP